MDVLVLIDKLDQLVHEAKAVPLTDQVRIDGSRLLRDEAAAGRRFGLVLLDPPYTLLPRLLPTLGDLVEAVAAPGALVALEAPAGLDVELGPGLDHRSATRTGVAVHHLFAACPTPNPSQH